MKVNFVLHRFTLAALSLIALATALPTRVLAQGAGKTGTTIVFDKNTSHALYGSNATGNSTATQYFAFLRHDITHVQMILSNYSKLSDNGTGSFNVNSNNMFFESNGYLSATSYLSGGNKIYLAIIAPKGYRFTRYQWEVDKAQTESSSTSGFNTNATGVTMSQYVYDASGSVSSTSNKLTITQDLQTWDVTLNQGGNILYFCIDANQTTKRIRVLLKSLKLTYVMDQPFENQLPGTDLSDNIHTGLLDLGEFSNTKNLEYANTLNPKPSPNGGKGFWSFDANRPATDLQTVNFYQGNGNNVSKATNEAVKVDDGQYYVAASNGDYYVEAPEKFRVIGAKLNFLKKNINGTRTEITYPEATTITSGKGYYISDNNGHYLVNNNGTISSTTDIEKATEWTISGSNGSYAIQSDGYYLRLSTSGNGSISLGTRSYASWRWDSNYGFYYYYNYYYYSLVCSNGTWSISRNYYSLPTNANKLQTRDSKTIEGVSYTAGNFTATPYTRENAAMDAVELSDDNTSATVKLTDYNNDAIHFSISGLNDGEVALYNVSLMLLPLNPELQHLSVASKINDAEVHPNTTSFSSENFEFNDKANVTVIVPEKDIPEVAENSCTVVFQNADNEDGTKWYSKGGNENDPSKGNYSNYFLVNGKADNGGTNAVNLDITASNAPEDRTSATTAGTGKLYATNIEELAKGNDILAAGGTPTVSRLDDNDFDKVAAAYADAKLTPDGEAKTYYIYTADMPTWNILPASAKGGKHIDFRYYTLNVICKVQKEKPVVTIVPIYTSTLKSQNHKNKDISADGNLCDTETTFFGVKVGYELADGSSGVAEGNLSSKDVVEAIDVAINDAVNNNTISIDEDANDPRRGMLYLDMSSLNSVDYTYFDADFNNSVADNCLYFMYKGFHRENVQNVIAKLANGTYEAVSNIVVLDQQPFFSPYDFTTGRYTVTYEREGTSNATSGTNNKVKNMAVVLPFDVQLDGKGHLKNASDETDNDVTYHNITGSGELKNVSADDPEHKGITYGVKASTMTEDKAEANKPYYVTTDGEGFKYTITGANFKASGTISDTKATPAELINDAEGSWKAIGSYNGVHATKADNLWYFSKDLFWKSGNLTQYDWVNIRPFRAYFETTDKTNASKALVVFDDSDIQPTGISDVTTDSDLLIAASHGTITMTAKANATYAIYTVAGQLVAKGLLSQGESRSISAAQGVYVINNQKIIVK